MKTIINLLVTTLFVQYLMAQEISFETIETIPTYPFDDANPLPTLVLNPKIYPYYIFEGYSTEKTARDFKIVRLGNEFIQVEILPEIGGKIWGAIDKSNGNEFVYKNEVVKFRNIAMRGPWTSGGIEFNFGIIGHHPSTASPVDYYTETLSDGTQVCTVGSIDLPSRTQWRVRIEVAPDKAAFTTRSTWYNPTATDKAYYNWMTAAAAAEKDLIFYTPGNAYLKHSGDALQWPIDPLNRNLSHYAQNNFGQSKSYHVVGAYNDFFGGYYHDKDVGFGHWSRYDEMPGQKLWLWDQSRFGGIWEDLLTDNDGQYIEYQAGRLLVQYFPGTENPITQTTFEPHRTDQWTEVWFPLKNTQGLSEASSLGALHLLPEEEGITLNVNAFVSKEVNIQVIQNGNSTEKKLHLKASTPYTFRFTDLNTEKPYEIRVEALELHYKSTPQIIKRPFVTAPDLMGYQSNSVELQKGIQALRYREFNAAEEHLTKLLKQDAAQLEARVALGGLYHDKGMTQKALDVVLKGLSLDTYHPGLNYMAGINYLAQKDWVNAKESFGWAAHSLKYRPSSYSYMSQIELLNKNYREALHYANLSLRYNSENIVALTNQYFALQKLVKNDLASITLSKIKSIDPLNHLLSAERYFKNEISAQELKNQYHRSEFPYQTFLELALNYSARGFQSKAIKVLENSPKNMLIDLWIAYLKKDSESLETIFKSNVDFIFPFRVESLKMLRWVANKSKHWKANYLLGLNLMGLHQSKAGLTKMDALRQEPDTANFYWIRSRLHKNNSSQNLTDAKHAYQLDPNNWRIALDYATALINKKDWKNALRILKKSYNKNPYNYAIGMRIVEALNETKRYKEAIDILNTLEVLPYEHATEFRNTYQKTYMGSTLEAIKNNNWGQAKLYLTKALEWPERLGVGKPYDAEERLPLFFLAYVSKKMGGNSIEYLQKIADYSKEHLSLGGKSCLTGLYAIQLSEGEEAAQIYARQLLKENNPEIEMVLNYFYKYPIEKIDVSVLDRVMTFIL